MKRIKITMRTNLFILISGACMLAWAALFHINFLHYESPIPYARWKEITFRDFRGLNRPGNTLDGQADFAFIESGIKVAQSSSHISVTTFFYPAGSYVFNAKLENDNLLTHELYHLHITEYCARQMRRDIKNVGHSADSKMLDNLQTRYRNMEDSLQMTYDDESYHSYITGQQLKWQRTIDSCLNSLKEFENPMIDNQ